MVSQVLTAVRARPRREREEEVLVWPDLVFIEFISAIIFTIALLVLSAFINAPLLDRADPNTTPNPSKAPWYFLNLQELLLHMEPAWAGVIVPTIALILLGAIPYWDRSNAGQGKWFASKDSIKITVWAFCIASLLTIWLILYDGAKHVEWTEDIIRGTGLNSDFTWPTWLDWARNLRGLDTGINWDDLSFSLGGFTIFQDWRAIPLGIPGTTTDPWLLNLNFPSFLSQQVVPVATMVGLPLLLVGFTKRKLGWIHSRRDIALLVFTGFIAVFIVTTAVGQFFRGQGQELRPPWDIVVVEE
ncbi:MAG: Cytochrome b(C-terminal)/b6/petD [Chloroflexi bacterium]|nr:MAG: Cytochrome b(C-terminal)/b6/petD [Chloroflexota bacterium]